MQKVREELIKTQEGFEIPIALLADKDQNGDFYYVRIDGVPWLYADNRIRAIHEKRKIVTIIQDCKITIIHYTNIIKICCIII